MWKIFFEFDDKSKCTITGETSDITLSQVIKYHYQYGVRATKETYQKYPKAKNKARDLYEVLEEMEAAL